MPRPRLWLGTLVMLASPQGFAEQKPAPVPVAAKAPEQPSAALLEFIGDWNPEERQLIGMETTADTAIPEQTPKEPRRAR